MLNFQELGLIPSLLKAVDALGYHTPMPVQETVIPILLSQPCDLVGLAQTGTGKTAAFGLPILQHLDLADRHIQALILCPTRELCLQITRDLQGFSRFMNAVKIVPVYGGASFDSQLRQLADHPQVVVATPGRLNDMIRRKKADLSHVKWVVLDEADEMLDMGFQEEVDTILEETPSSKNTLLFSATLPEEVERILARYMNNPVIKTIGQRNTGTANVKHIYYMVHAKERYLALKRIADFHPRIYAIIFCRTRAETQEIADSLIRDGYNADSLHGDLSQAQRDHVMKRFRDGRLQMLVATDVAARGLDVSDLTHVVNYNLPDDPDIYIHRSGRTGRADKTGISISLIHLKEKHRIREIEKKVGREFARAKVPTGVQVCEKQLFHHIDRMENVELNHGEIDSYLPVIYRKLEWIDREELIKRFVALEFNRFLDYYRNAPDLNIEDSHNTPSSVRRYQRMFISVGRKDRISPEHIIRIVNEITRSNQIKIGRIDIKHAFSFLDVDSQAVETLKRCFADEKLNPQKIRIEMASERISEHEYRQTTKLDHRKGVRPHGRQEEKKPEKMSKPKDATGKRKKPR